MKRFTYENKIVTIYPENRKALFESFIPITDDVNVVVCYNRCSGSLVNDLLLGISAEYSQVVECSYKDFEVFKRELDALDKINDSVLLQFIPTTISGDRGKMPF